MVMGHLGGIAIAPHLYKDLPFDPINDLSPVTLCVNGLSVLVVNPDLPVKTVGELIAYAKANPSKLSFSSAGRGTDTHLAGELFSDDWHVHGARPLQGRRTGAGGPARRARAARVCLGCDNDRLNPGKLRAIAMTGKNGLRVSGRTDHFGVRRARLRDQQLVWNFCAREDAEENIQRVNAETIKVLQKPEVRAKLIAAGLEPL